MRIRLEMNELKTAWARLKRVKTNKTTRPILKSVFFGFCGDRLVLARTNLEQAMEITVPCVHVSHSEGWFCLPDQAIETLLKTGWRHISLCSNTVAATGRVEAWGFEHQKVEFPAYPGDDYPQTDWHNQWDGGQVGKFSATGKEIKTLCQYLTPIVKLGVKARYGGGFAIAGGNEAVYAIATDSKVMVKHSLPYGAATDLFTMPISWASFTLLKMAWGAKDPVTVRILHDANQDDHHLLHAVAGNCSICIRQAVENFPDWQKIYKSCEPVQENTTCANVDTGELLMALAAQEPIHTAVNLSQGEIVEYFYLGISPGKMHVTTWAGHDYWFAAKTDGHGVVALAWSKAKMAINPASERTKIIYGKTDAINGPTEDAIKIVQENIETLLMPMYGDDEYWKKAYSIVS